MTASESIFVNPILADIREGLGYVRARAWLWGTLSWFCIVNWDLFMSIVDGGAY